MKPTLFVDMDDTIAQFIGDERLLCIPITHLHQDYKEMHEKEFFRKQVVMPGAKKAIKTLLDSQKFEIYILSVPLATSPHSYSEKVEWISEHFPELLKRIVFTQDKSLIRGNFLVDDSILWQEPWENNGGDFIRFDPRKNAQSQWERITDYLLSQVK